MVAPTATEKFINWITGTPIALFDALGSVFNASGTTSSIGLVPNPGSTPGTSKFLREDATWVAPPNTSVFVAAGASHASGAVPDPGATSHTPPPWLLGDDAAFRNYVSQGFNLINGTITVTNNGTAATFAIKTLLGNDPSASDAVYIIFRNSAAGTGNYTILAITSAFNVVVSSGSTLGASNATAFRIWLVCFNDAGTARLGVINCNNANDIYPLAAWQIASSTAEGGAGNADSAAVFYTGTAVTSMPYSILGYLSWETGLTTAGTWNANATRIQILDGGTPTPNEVIQTVATITGASTTGTTAIPQDDTIPQITEGNEFMTKAITPTSACNVLEIESNAVLANTNINVGLAIALFQDATANALTAINLSQATASFINDVGPLFWRMLAATSSSTTFRIRGGAGTGATTTFNGSAGARQFGGVMNSYLRVRELMA